MGTLFLKECKIHIKSLLFLVYIFLFSLFFLTQFWDFPVVVKPKENANGYGWTTSSDPKIIMNKTIDTLLGEFNNNRYRTYPIGFYKEVKLNEKKANQVIEIIEEIIGLPIEEVETLYLDYWNKAPKLTGDSEFDMANFQKYEREHPFEMPLAENMTYEKFADSLMKVDKILGGGSYYHKDNLQKNAYIPMTYEQALEEYESIIRDDKVIGAYARLFCDYMGLMLGILPVFLAVSRELRDKKSKAALVIYSKKYSSLKIVFARYSAIFVVSLLPVVIFAIILLGYIGLQADAIGVSLDILLYFSYLGSWLIPTAGFTISLGMFCSVFTGNILGILVQAIIWIIAIFSGNIEGQAGFNFIPRFNCFGSYSSFKTIYESFVTNRIFYVIVSLVLFFITVIVFEQKRKGGLEFHGNLSSN